MENVLYGLQRVWKESLQHGAQMAVVQFAYFQLLIHQLSSRVRALVEKIDISSTSRMVRGGI